MNKIKEGNLSENHLLGAVIVYCVFLFIIVLIRSVITGLIYDEAYTYLKYGRANLFDIRTLYHLFKSSLANNHWLNSFLIFLIIKITHVEYCEFLIRLPQLLFLLLYMTGAVYGWRKKHYSFPVLIVLLSNYYLLEFYGLARGYAMANTLVFFSLLSYNAWYRTKYSDLKHLNWLIIYMSLAVLSNTITLLLYPAFGLLCLMRLIQQKQLKTYFKKCGALFLLFMAFSLVMVIYHMLISQADRPLYTGGEAGFFDSVVKGFVDMFIRQNALSHFIAIIVSLCIICSLIIINKKITQCDYIIMLLIFVATNLFAEFVFHKGYIATRELLPFYTFIIMSLYELINETFHNLHIQNRSQIKKGLAVLICSLTAISCLSQTNIFTTHDWAEEYVMKDYVLGKTMTGVPYTPLRTYRDYAEIFYQEKYELLSREYLIRQEQNGQTVSK